MCEDVPPGVLRHEEDGRTLVLERVPPSSALAAFVEHHWSVTWDVPGVSRQEAVPYPGVNVSVEDGVATVTGVVTRRFLSELAGRGRVDAVRFRAGGFSAFSAVPVRALTDRRLPAAQVLPDLAADLDALQDAPDPRARVEELLLSRDPVLAPAAAFVNEAIELLGDDPSIGRVDDLAQRLAVTTRTLQRRFEEHLGVGAKWVLQRKRLHEALAVVDAGGEVSWSALAADLGFTDQAHLTRTFTDIVGVPPETYRRRGAPA